MYYKVFMFILVIISTLIVILIQPAGDPCTSK